MRPWSCAKTRSSTIPGTWGRRGWRPRPPRGWSLGALPSGCRFGAGDHQGRRFLPVRRAASTRRMRAGRRRSPCWEKVKKLQPERPGREPARSMRLSAELDDQAGEARRSPGPAGRPAKQDGTRAAGVDGRQARAAQTGAAHSRAAAGQRNPRRPQGTHAYVELAEIYRSAERFGEGGEGACEGPKADPNDAGLKSVYEDTQISRLEAGDRRPVADESLQNIRKTPAHKVEARPVDRNAEQVSG